MDRMFALMIAMLPALAMGQTWGPTITGVETVVNDDPGNQNDPHVSGDIVAYTADTSFGTAIRYHDLATGTDQMVPNPGTLDFLSDVHGTTIVFTRIGMNQAIYRYDLSVGGTPDELDPGQSDVRQAAAIGEGVVAWEELGIAGVAGSEIVVLDLVTNLTQRLTTDDLTDRNPAVSSDGQVVAWVKCSNDPSDPAGCDIYASTRSGGAFGAPVRLTSAAGDESSPDSNGAVVVYATAGADRDIAWQSAAGGTEERLALDGHQSNPAISRHLIAFEHQDSVGGSTDIVLYDLNERLLYRLTDTPTLNETLTDITIGDDGLVRVVWTVSESGDENVYAFTFRAEGPSCEEQPQPTCDDPGDAPLLAALDLTRGKGKPQDAEVTFTAQPGEALLCVRNRGATAGWVDVNGEGEVCPDRFKKKDTVLSKGVTVDAENTLSARVAGKPGSGFTVEIYGMVPRCTTMGADPLSAESLRVTRVTGSNLRTVGGSAALVDDEGEHHVEWASFHPRATGVMGQGCSQGGSTAGAVPLLTALALWALWMFRRRPVAVPARRRR